MRIHWNRIKNRCLAALAAGMIAATALAVNPVTARAAETGTITIAPQGLDATYTGTFNIYHVATDAGDQQFTRTENFQDYSGEWLDDIDPTDDEKARKIAEALDAYVKANNTEADIENVKINDPQTVDYGVYLIRQATSDPKYTDTVAFLVIVPQYTQNQDGTIDVKTDITVAPKCSKIPDKDTPPGDDNPPGGGGGGNDNPPGGTEESGEETPVIEEIGEETPGVIEDIGGFTGDDSNMMLYGATVAVAAAAMIGWFVWNRRKADK